MRIIVSAVLATGLLSAGIAAAQPCAKPADVTAFDVASLKSKLMVTALTCNQQDRYNDFVQRFRADLMTHERALHAYFVRAFGGRAQREHDDYITSLANTQSRAASRQGTLFCQQNVGIFTEVMALAKGSDLPGTPPASNCRSRSRSWPARPRPAPHRPAPAVVSQRYPCRGRIGALPAPDHAQHAPAPAPAARQVVLGRRQTGGSRSATERARTPRRRRHAPRHA